MKKLLIGILIIMTIGLGCVPAAATTPATPVVSPITELQTWRTTTDTWKATVADPAIAKMNAQVAPTNLQPQIDSAKSVITDMQKQIADLTKRVTDSENAIKTLGTQQGNTQQLQPYQQGSIPQFQQGTTPTTVTPSPSGAVVSQVNVVSGNLQIASSTIANSQPIWYVQRLTNYNSAMMYVRPIIQISQSTQYGWNNTPVFVNATTIAINSVQCSMTVSGSSNGTVIVGIIGNSGTVNANSPSTDTYQMSVSPGLGYQTASISYQPVKGCGTPSGEMYLSPGGYMDLTVQISGFVTSAPAFWTVTPSLSYHP